VHIQIDSLKNNTILIIVCTVICVSALRLELEVVKHRLQHRCIEVYTFLETLVLLATNDVFGDSRCFCHITNFRETVRKVCKRKMCL